MLLSTLKGRVETARQRAVLSVNRELFSLYWNLGREMLARHGAECSATRLVERLSGDLRASFPDMKGFSPKNLKYMQALAQGWPDGAILDHPAAGLPWAHVCTLLDRLKDRELREWYASESLRHGWSRNVLALQIALRLHERSGRGVNNFAERLAPPQSDLAREVFKDPYILDFVGLADDARERAIEAGLMQHVTKFLLELGSGFAFVARQYRMEIGGDEFYVDLLFYHLQLRCYVVVELKATAFRPEYAGQLNFYLSAVDDRLKGPEDKPTIGLLLCRERSRLVAEYALRGMANPMGVSEYHLIREIPEELASQLPSIGEIEAELASEAADLETVAA